MNELTLTMREKVLQFEDLIRQAIDAGVPQPEWLTNHYFHGGMYAREMEHPAGMYVVGKVHKKENFFIVTKGTVKIVLDDSVEEFTAPAILKTTRGTKRVVYSEHGATYMTVHRTNKKTVAAVVKEMVEDDPKAGYDALNQSKLKELK